MGTLAMSRSFRIFLMVAVTVLGCTPPAVAKREPLTLVRDAEV